ncbi:Elf1-domain-containing protein [Thelephora ganbajun]|uniref:Elf1-domain-containing protein n=1 Tax=Thelephora ganbajun TaxID=370292 RepID=A0ACB6ZTU6_THEGA|nr:Elf1-domain-containing protein [Thelephora ganbajun]
MGKRKKSSRKPTGPKKKVPLDTTFTCLFCHHDNSVNIRVDRKEGVALLVCKVCDQRYQSKVNHLTEPIDIYSEWIDAADAAQNEAPPRRPTASSSRAAPRAAAPASDDD